jgi:glycosyltransferase involved in cell wall biosynthesis
MIEHTAVGFAEVHPGLRGLTVSVVVPAYNEEHGIGGVLDELNQILPQSGLDDYEIIVIDDGSTDNTAQVVKEHHNHVTLLRHNGNRGYGAALKSGIRHARGEVICITDADGTYPNERIPDLLARLVEYHYDMVTGARTGANVHIPLIRKPAKWFINRLADYVVNQRIPDLNSGLRVFRREACLRMFNLLPDGFSFTTTITLSMLVNGYLVDYLPIDYHARVGKSKIRPIRDTINFTRLVLSMALYFAPMKVFVPMSLVLFFIGLVWGVSSTFLIGRFADASTLMILMAGVQVFVMGMLAELINRRLSNYHRGE